MIESERAAERLDSPSFALDAPLPA
ncbi:MAG: hypothetical protein K0R41_3882, partial [Geminicoccaceae bacterium]|nr:hypothetical protein [Geminicoccaceae bacterium]